MTKAKQMMDMKSTTSAITTAESNEQQRNWNRNMWVNKSNDPMKNYDPTRAHLNFEVARGGKIQPIDTSMSIDEKMNQILQARGIKNPNTENCKQPQRILAKFIFGGDRDRMRELAYGVQKVDYNKGADNSHITREEAIEKWAVGVYKFACKRYGEENIVSFYVHLDEINPHIHCTLLPVDKTKNRISWTSVFGKTKKEESETMRDAHTAFFKEVGSKWGLDRGSDVKVTGAKHRSTAEYERLLINHVEELEDTIEGLKKQIATEERKRKSFTTMIENLQKRKDDIEKELSELGSQLGVEGQDPEELAKKINKLRKEMETLIGKLDERKQMLDNTNALLAEAREKLAQLKEVETTTAERVNQLKRDHAHMAKLVNGDYMDKAEREFANIRGTFYKMLDESISPVIGQLDRDQRETLYDNGYYDLKEDGEKVINCATLLAINFIKEAITYAESHGGGGGGSSLSGWGRKKDDAMNAGGSAASDRLRQ